jgi:hypothetical protein
MTRCWISQGYLWRFLGYPWDIPNKGRIQKIRKPGMGYPNISFPKLVNDKCRVSFFVLRYLSLSHPILITIQFSTMQLVAQKSCLAQPNNSYILLPITIHHAHSVHRAHVYLHLLCAWYLVFGSRITMFIVFGSLSFWFSENQMSEIQVLNEKLLLSL